MNKFALFFCIFILKTVPVFSFDFEFFDIKLDNFLEQTVPPEAERIWQDLIWESWAFAPICFDDLSLRIILGTENGIVTHVIYTFISTSAPVLQALRNDLRRTLEELAVDEENSGPMTWGLRADGVLGNNIPLYVNLFLINLNMPERGVHDFRFSVSYQGRGRRF